MALPFQLHISADIDFLPVSDVPELTARGIYPLSDDEPDSQVLKRAACRMNHEQALDRAIDDGQVTVLNPVSYEPHTFPLGAARQEAVMTVDDFKRFAQSLQIEVAVDEAENLEAGASTGELNHSIDRNMVMGAFPVKSDPDENIRFWNGKLGRPPKWLEDARVDPGRPGQSALWDPLQLAHCLLGRKQMNLRQLDAVMSSNYPDLFDDWNDQTADMR